MHWYVLTTRAQWQAELILRNALHRVGVPAFVPVQIEDRWFRRTNRRAFFTMPLFPRYVFTGWVGDPNYDMLRAERMWTGILGNGGKPSLLDQKTVDNIVILSKLDTAKRARFTPGERVLYDMRVAEVRATIERLEADTATIRFEMLGKEHRATVPEAALVAEGV